MSPSSRGTLIYLQELSQEYTVCALLFTPLPIRDLTRLSHPSLLRLRPVNIALLNHWLSLKAIFRLEHTWNSFVLLRTYTCMYDLRQGLEQCLTHCTYSTASCCIKKCLKYWRTILIFYNRDSLHLESVVSRIF